MGARRVHRKTSLRGWWRVLPFLLLPFGVFLYQAWLHTEILANQYEVNDLTVSIRETRDMNRDLSDAKYHLERMVRIDEKAPDLGLMEPKPGQLIFIVPSDGEQLDRSGGPARTTVSRYDP